jgi:hypothetical protein
MNCYEFDDVLVIQLLLFNGEGGGKRIDATKKKVCEM